MPLFQIKSKVNSQTINTDLECSTFDDAISFYNALSVAEILDVKKYVYLNRNPVKKLDDKKYRYATVKITFKHTLPITIKIPKLKNRLSVLDIQNYFKSIYRNIETISVNIKDTF